MKITIITACYNAIATIGDAMASVAGQRLGESEKCELGIRNEGTSLEYIVVDGGSTDGTVDLIRKFEAKVKEGDNSTTHHSSLITHHFTFRWISERDKGMYDAINKGIRMASGDVIGILNADDVLADEDVVAKVDACFCSVNSVCSVVNNETTEYTEHTENTEVDCVYGKVRFVNELGGKTVRRCFAKLWRPWMLQWGYMPPHPGVFIRRECFEKWGGYVGDRKEYVIAADYELLIRFFRVHKMRAVYSGLCTTVMRTGGVSTKDVGARKLLNQEIIKGNRANGYFCCWAMLLPKYAIKVWEVILPRIGLVG